LEDVTPNSLVALHLTRSWVCGKTHDSRQKHKEVTWYQKARQQEHGVARSAKESLALAPGSFKGKSKESPGTPRTGSKGFPETPDGFPTTRGNATLMLPSEHFE